MLDIKNVKKTFNKGTINEKKALNGINLHLNEGDFVNVIGVFFMSGCLAVYLAAWVLGKKILDIEF